jgi:hypothetical protein
MTKKATDASSILGAARRAADVPRPKMEEEPVQAALRSGSMWPCGPRPTSG